MGAPFVRGLQVPCRLMAVGRVLLAVAMVAAPGIPPAFAQSAEPAAESYALSPYYRYGADKQRERLELLRERQRRRGGEQARPRPAPPACAAGAFTAAAVRCGGLPSSIRCFRRAAASLHPPKRGRARACARNAATRRPARSGAGGVRRALPYGSSSRDGGRQAAYRLPGSA